MKKTYFLFAVLFFIALYSVSCTSVISRVNVDENGVAMKGFDPVAYFTVGEPVKGNEKISYEWKGATWLFSSNDHKSLFIQNPEGYAPQYGGY
jgi:YHS domain-containing protein